MDSHRSAVILLFLLAALMSATTACGSVEQGDTKYTLYYFPMRMRAEPIRLLLHYLNVTFEDVTISWADWPAERSSKDFLVFC